ncbi:MAG: plastocyanin/azurin family copper-binding protein [Candidatus Bathyarchaeia archaeon]
MKTRIFLVFTLILVIGLLSTLTATTTKAQTSGTSITLYAGSVTSGSGTYGYGDSASKITSPGPTLNLQEGTTYTITVNNPSNMPHSFEIVSSQAISNSPLFGAGIDITNFIPAGGSGSVTFTPNQTGNFYYVCTVPAHISLGMWGNVVVSSTTPSPSPTVPEFPSALTLMFMVLAMTALAAFAARQKIRPKYF